MSLFKEKTADKQKALDNEVATRRQVEKECKEKITDLETKFEKKITELQTKVIEVNFHNRPGYCPNAQGVAAMRYPGALSFIVIISDEI